VSELNDKLKNSIKSIYEKIKQYKFMMRDYVYVSLVFTLIALNTQLFIVNKTRQVPIVLNKSEVRRVENNKENCGDGKSDGESRVTVTNSTDSDLQDAIFENTDLDNSSSQNADTLDKSQDVAPKISNKVSNETNNEIDKNLKDARSENISKKKVSSTSPSSTSSTDKTVNHSKVKVPEKKAPINRIVNINTASVVELQTLSGIGPRMAERIIEYRRTKSFASIEDLMEVSGIGEKKFESIKKFIRV